jgi:hypothetical protein
MASIAKPAIQTTVPRAASAPSGWAAVAVMAARAHETVRKTHRPWSVQVRRKRAKSGLRASKRRSTPSRRIRE